MNSPGYQPPAPAAGTTAGTFAAGNDARIAGAAPLASPALTGTPTAPTPPVNTITAQVATAAFVLGQAASATPLADGAAAAGTSTLFARQDHVHPTDATRAPLASPALTGTPTAPTAAAGTSTTQLSTTAFVTGALAGYLPLSGGTLTGPLTVNGQATFGAVTASSLSGLAAPLSVAQGGTGTAAGGLDGGCRLSVASTTSLLLSPVEGGVVLVNGAPLVLPSAGVTLSGPAVVASTLYYAYLGGTTAAPALSLSTTGFVRDANGRAVMSGDATRRLVGMVFTDGSAHFVDSASARTCLNWFNRRALSAIVAVNGSSTSTSAAAIGTVLHVLSWSDESLLIGCSGNALLNTAGALGTAGAFVDGASVGGGSAFQPYAANSYCNPAFVTAAAVADGHHTVQASASTSSGQVTLSAQLTVIVRG